MNRVIPFAEALKSIARDDSASLAAARGRALDRGHLDQFDTLADAIDRIGDGLEVSESQIESLHAMFDALASSYREMNERLLRLEGRKED